MGDVALRADDEPQEVSSLNDAAQEKEEEELLNQLVGMPAQDSLAETEKPKDDKKKKKKKKEEEEEEEEDEDSLAQKPDDAKAATETQDSLADDEKPKDDKK